MRACAVALGVALAAVAAPVGRAAAATVQVRVASTGLTAPRPANFLGLALETKTIPQWIGDAPTAAQVDPVLVKLIRGLDPTGSPVIRVGGESTDRSWWPVPHVATPAGITYALTPTWAADLHSLAVRLNARLIVGINLEANSLAISRYEADQLLSRIGARYFDAMEIGNEPDLYSEIPWYNLQDGKPIPWYLRHAGTPVLSRPVSWDETDFLSEFERTLAVLPRGVGIAGPDAVSTTWLPPFDRLVSPGGRIRVIDSHEYPLAQCESDPASAHYPSIANLLAPGAWEGVLNGAQSSIALAHRDHVQFRIDEMGSVTCEGHAGVSNTMASALWVTDALFNADREGADGVNLHTYPGVANDLFELSRGAQDWNATIHPIYDGAAFFARADPAGSRLLALSSNEPSTLKTWATISGDHHVRVLLDNSGGWQLVKIRAPAGFGSRTGDVQRLLAPSVTSTSGLTIATKPYDTTTTGVFPAPRLQPAVSRGGYYTIAAPPYSETMLTLSR